MKNNWLKYLFGAFLLIPILGVAQENWEKPAGGIENAQVVIEKDKVISLRPVSRRFKAIQLAVPVAKSLDFNYQLADVKDSFPSLQVIVRPKMMRDEPLEKLFGITGKFGFGNYNSPFILLNAGNKRSDEYMYNVQFNHYSSLKGPVADKFSSSGLTRLGGTTKYYFNNVILSASASYKNQRYTMYGYDPAEISAPGFNEELHKQRLNRFGVRIGIVENNLKNDTDQDFAAGIHYLKNNHAMKEFMADAAYDLRWRMADNWQLDLGMGYSILSQNDSISASLSRQYAKLSPVVRYTVGPMQLAAGMNSYFQQDPLDGSASKFYFFPNMAANYTFMSKHTAGISLMGEIEQMSLDKLYGQNLYLDSLIQANNNIKDISAELKLEGKLTDNIGYRVAYVFEHYKRLQFFKNNALDTARFVISYDEGGATNNRFESKITYFVNDKLNLAVNGAINLYNTVDEVAAWHKPRSEVGFTARTTVFNKLHGRISYTMLGGMKAQSSSGTITLDTVHDLNLGLDLMLSERAGFFIDLKNILGNNYQVYNNYPVKGFQVIGGVGIKL